MGTYVNPSNRQMQIALNDEIFVDKSMILTVLNKKFDTKGRFMCVSRPRRFGKTTVGDLISAFYSKGANSRAMFEKLKIAGEPNWDERLNKFNVIQFDINAFYSRYQDKGDIITHLTADVVREMVKEFPNIQINPDGKLSSAIISVFEETGVPFVVIIDEYDVLVREKIPSGEFRNYLAFLNDLFKSPDCGAAIGLAYMTGIMPIVKDRVESKLNNFHEYTMLDPQELAPYIGFTKPEVKELCEQFKIDYDECLRWYDGYDIAPGVSICNSNSVCRAITSHKFANYWNRTGAYAAISDYVKMNFDGVKEDIATMIGGGRVPVSISAFSNTLSDLGDKNRVFTYLIHLGYLTYKEKNSEGDGWASIPNGEIRNEWKTAIGDMKDMSKVVEMIRNSEELLEATLQRDEAAVAEALDKAHTYVTSAKYYNNEGALQSAVGLAYFSATSQYDINQELAAGYGFCDIAFKPYVKGAPGVIIELKMDQAPEFGLKQIKKNKYVEAMGSYRGPVYLVAVSYGKESKKHTCKIEVVER